MSIDPPSRCETKTPLTFASRRFSSMSKYGRLSRRRVKRMTRVGVAAGALKVESTCVNAEASVSSSAATARVRFSSALLMKTKCFERASSHFSSAAGKGIGPLV